MLIRSPPFPFIWWRDYCTVCVMVALWLVPLKYRSYLPHNRKRLWPGVKFKLGTGGSWGWNFFYRFSFMCHRSGKWVGALKERRKKRHFWPLKRNSLLTYKDVKDFSPQTYDNHFDRAFQLWPFSTFLGKVFECQLEASWPCGYGKRLHCTLKVSDSNPANSRSHWILWILGFDIADRFLKGHFEFEGLGLLSISD